RAGAQRGRHVVHGANAAADRERDEQALGGPPRQVEQRAALLVRCGDVEKHDLVRAGTFVALGEFDGIADVTQPLELHAFHDTPLPHVEAHDQSPCEAHRPFRFLVRTATLPFVLNTVPVSASAWASEKPSALNAASTTWCLSSPRSTRMWSVNFPASQNERIQCSKKLLGIGPR